MLGAPDTMVGERAVGSVQDPAWHLAGANADNSLHGSRAKAGAIHPEATASRLPGSKEPAAASRAVGSGNRTFFVTGRARSPMNAILFWKFMSRRVRTCIGLHSCEQVVGTRSTSQKCAQPETLMVSILPRHGLAAQSPRQRLWHASGLSKIR